MTYQGPIRPGMRYMFDGDECTVSAVGPGKVTYSWVCRHGDKLSTWLSETEFRRAQLIRPTTPEEWALFAPEGPINNQLRAADLRPGMVIATCSSEWWWVWRVVSHGRYSAEGTVLAATKESPHGPGRSATFVEAMELAHSIILFDAEDAEALDEKPITATAPHGTVTHGTGYSKREPWNADCFDDPRDAAIAKWPWMARFRDVKAGDVFSSASNPGKWTVNEMLWSNGQALFRFERDDGTGCDPYPWAMAAEAWWIGLRPYAPTAPTCNTCHKPEPLGYAGRCWGCELKEEKENRRRSDDLDKTRAIIRRRTDCELPEDAWGNRIRADMAIDVSPIPGGAGFGSLWRGRVPR